LYVLIGGSSGIGRGAVLLLSKLGCSVAFGGRNKEELDKVAAKCKEDRIDAQVYNLDNYCSCNMSIYIFGLDLNSWRT